MYRTLLATCGSEEKEICISNELKHMKKTAVSHVASNVRYIVLSMRTNSVLTPCKVQYFHVIPRLSN